MFQVDTPGSMKTLGLRSVFCLPCKVKVWEGRRFITQLSGIGPFPAAPQGSASSLIHSRAQGTTESWAVLCLQKPPQAVPGEGMYSDPDPKSCWSGRSFSVKSLT